ncbi:MAG: hypothetical protein ACKVH8_21755 [Pirellulales bacterium]
MKRHSFYITVVCLLVVSQLATNTQAVDTPTSYYLIGNSLTWDTVPAKLDGDTQWHVDCGKSLPFIIDNPEKPCVGTSTLWPSALKNKQYDFVSVQPHYGSTLDQDISTISHWIEMQPTATLVIHTGWAHHEKRAEEYAKEKSNNMQHSPAYFKALITALKQKYPNRNFKQTHAIDLLAQIAKDIEAGKAPLKDVNELHRDAIHVKIDTGRYLMHNAMRHALGQSRSSVGFESLKPEIKKYLDSVLDTLQK